MIAALETAGISIVSTANNHSRDCGSYGVEFTLSLVKAAWHRYRRFPAVGRSRASRIPK